MNRFYAVLIALALCLALFLQQAWSGGTLKAGATKELCLALDTEPQTLDPIAIADTLSDGVAHKCYNTLVRLERDESNKLVVKPELTESFNISPDGKIYTFQLRKGVRFHNGREMKASDAEYSLRRLLASPMSKRSDWIKPFVKDSEAYFKSRGEGRVGIRATGDYELTIELEAPFAPFIQHLCTINCAVVAREAAEDKTKIFSRTPVGTGPFKLIEWIVNSSFISNAMTTIFAASRSSTHCVS